MHVSARPLKAPVPSHELCYLERSLNGTEMGPNFDNARHRSQNWGKSKNTGIALKGAPLKSALLYSSLSDKDTCNSTIFIAVQNLIKDTDRFT